MIKKLIVGVLVATLLLPLLGGCNLFKEQSDDPPRKDSLYVESRRYDPEWAVVPLRLIGDALGTTEQDITFEPYQSTSPSGGSLSADAQQNPFAAVIAAGSAYYEIEGYDSKTYLALEIRGNYFLYANSPKERVNLSQDSDALVLVETPATRLEHLYQHAFTYVSSFSNQFVVLDVQNVEVDDIDYLIGCCAQFSDSVGCTLLITSFETIEEKGYLTYGSGSHYEWSFPGGSFVTLGPGEISGNSASIEASFLAGPLFGSGERFSYENEDGLWVFKGIEQLWIS